MITTTAAAKISGNITKENVEQVARLVKADPHCPEAAAFFNFADTSVPYNQVVRKWLYTRKFGVNLLKDISMEDYLQAYSLYLFEHMQTEWDSNTYDFHDYFIVTTRSKGAFCGSLIRGYCEYRYFIVPDQKDDNGTYMDALDQSDTTAYAIADATEPVPDSMQAADTSLQGSVKMKRHIPYRVHMDDIDECSELTDANDFTQEVEARMGLDRLFADLKLHDINRDILIEYINNGNNIWTNGLNNYNLPYNDIRQFILSKYGILLNNAQIYQKIRYSTQKVRSRIQKKGMRIQDYS